MKSFIYQLAVIALSVSPTHSNKFLNVIKASQDASLRRDRWDENFGHSKQLTVTPEDARSARVAVMKFDTSHVNAEDVDGALLLLRLFITDSSATPDSSNTVSIARINDDFNEHHVSWDSFHYDVSDEWIEFDVHHDHQGKTGQVDISSLFVPGEDLKIAIHMKETGHVKFASKEHNDTNNHPKLIFMESEEL
jgi:hypothetical protein